VLCFIDKKYSLSVNRKVNGVKATGRIR